MWKEGGRETALNIHVCYGGTHAHVCTAACVPTSPASKMCTLPSVSPQARRWPVEHHRSLDIATSSCSVSRGTWEGEKKKREGEKEEKSEGGRVEEGGIHKG